MGMSSPEWSRYMHDVIGLQRAARGDQRRGRATDARALPRALPLIDGAVEAVERLADALAARARLVVEPRADRRRARGWRASRGASRRRSRPRRWRRASRRRTSTSRRRGGSASRPSGAPRSRTRERDPLGARGRHARDRDPEPALSAARRHSRARPTSSLVARRADRRAAQRFLTSRHPVANGEQHALDALVVAHAVVEPPDRLRRLVAIVRVGDAPRPERVVGDDQPVVGELRQHRLVVVDVVRLVGVDEDEVERAVELRRSCRAPGRAGTRSGRRRPASSA